MEEAEKGAFVPKITIQEFDELMAQEMPWAVEAGMALEAIGPDHAAMRLPFNDVMLRPGGSPEAEWMSACPSGSAEVICRLIASFSAELWFPGLETVGGEFGGPADGDTSANVEPSRISSRPVLFGLWSCI